MEYLYCETPYGGGGYENWHAPKPEELEESENQEAGQEEMAGEPIVEAKETISQYEELMKQWAEIIEKGPSWDPALLAAKRQDVSNLLLALGILDEDGKSDIKKLLELSRYITTLKEVPIKKKDYPNPANFHKSFVKAKEENPDLFDDLKGRGEDVESYLYGLGIIMDNEIVYENIFADNPIVKGKNGQVENGRHRVACMTSLAKSNYSVIHPWIKIKYEK